MKTTTPQNPRYPLHPNRHGLRPRFGIITLTSILALACFVRSGLAQQILPLGDSITDGYQIAGGYRTELYKKLTNSGAVFTFLGSQTDNPSTILTAGSQIHHEGHSGYRADQIYNNLLGSDGTAGNNGGHWLDGGNGTGRSAISPGIVLVHIGTNDRTQGENVPTMYSKLVTLLNDLKAALPNAKVFVASLIPRTDNGTYEADQQAYNALIPGLVASLGANFHFVDMHSVVTPAQVAAGNSGVHPNQAGYDAMGDAWFNAIQTQQGVVSEHDQSNIGDNSNDANNSTFYFTSSQTTQPAAALKANLLTGSLVTGNAPDVGTIAGINDLSPGTGGNGSGTTYGSYNNMTYYGNGQFGNSLVGGALVTNTISLGGASPVAGGYTLSSILVFSGWTDHASFCDQHYTVFASRDGTNYVPLQSVNYMPFAAAADIAQGQDASTLVTLTNLDANGLAAGIRFVRFVYSAGLDGNGSQQEGQLIQEIEVFGSASTPALAPGAINEFDQSAIGDNNSDASNSQFYFTSGQSLNTSAALQANLLTGSTVISSTGGADVGSTAAANDGLSQPGTGGLDYYGNTLYGSSLNSGNGATQGKVALTIPLGGASPSPTGYSLSSLSVFCGWQDHASFSDQNYDVLVSRDGVNYLYLYTVHYMPFLVANDQGAGQSSSSAVALTNLNASGLATGIKYVRFSFSAGSDANNQAQQGLALQEIEVFGTATPADAVVENDQSNIGDNGDDSGNSQFYFTSGQTTTTGAALIANLLTGSTVTSSTGGADVGGVSAVNDLNAVSGTGAIAYYGNTQFGSSLNPSTALTHGVVTLTIPLGGANPAPGGYTLNNMKVFEGWSDHASFNDQYYTVSVSTDGTNFTYLHAVNFMPFAVANDIVPGGDQLASTLVSLSNLKVSGAKAIRFSLSAGADANGALQQGQLLQEIEVFGNVGAATSPVINQTAFNDSDLILSGTNGVAFGTYYVLSSTNVAAPLGTWSRVSTNAFDANGRFSVTNAINPKLRSQFFRLQLQ